MSIPEFKEKLQAIYQTLFREEALDKLEVEQNYFQVLSPFVASNLQNSQFLKEPFTSLKPAFT